MPATIVLVDDHPVFRRGLRHLLEKEKDLKVVGEAGDGLEAIDRIREHSPDILVMDITMPNLDGIEATRQILSEFPDTKVVALSVHSGRRFVRDMIQAGAAGYILKESIPEEMIKGIRTVLSGNIYLSKTISEVMVSDYKTLISEPGSEPDGLSSLILYTKLNRPPIASHIVPRTRLIEVLENGVEKPVTLIAAPAGYGKSILASQWLDVSETPGTWLSLDESDNDERTFFSYVFVAIQNLFPQLVLKTKSLLGSDHLPPTNVIGRYLLNDLEPMSERFVLVLDDYHHIRNFAIHDFLTELLLHPSPVMHLALLTRRDPPLPLTSLRARGLLNEISQENLRFTFSETKSFLKRNLEIAITDKTAKILEGKMEGWVTGLLLAVLSIRNQADQERLTVKLMEMMEPFHYVREYLIQEVLSHVPPQFSRYLMQTSILNRFCPQLCDAVCKGDSGQNQTEADGSARDFIDWLIKMHFFVIPLDRSSRWYRFHHLFQQLLQQELERHHRPEEISELHSRAGHWFESQGLIDDSIRHALAAGDSIRAAEIVERHRHAELDRDRWHVVQRWFDMLPAEIEMQRPGLLLTRLFLLADQYRLLDMVPIIERVESLLGDETEDKALLGELDFHRGTLLVWVHCDGEGARKRLEMARKRFPEKRGMMTGRLECYLGMALHMAGEGELAIESIEKKIRETDSHEDAFFANLNRTVVFIHLLSGHLDRTVRTAQRLLLITTKGGLSGMEAMSHYILANAQLQSYDLHEALQCFLIAVEKRYIVNRRIAVDALAGLALTYQAMQRKDEAVNTMKKLLEFARETGDSKNVALAESCQARIALLLGDLKSAIRWAQSFDAEPHVSGTLFWLEVPVMTQARVHIASGTDENLGKALESLEVLRMQVEASHFTCQTIEISVLQSMALDKLGRTDEALSVLEEVVVLSEPRGWVRPFVEWGSPMADLLKRLLRQNVAVDYIEKLLAVFTNDTPKFAPDGDDPYEKSPRLPTSPSDGLDIPPSPHPPVHSSTRLQPLVEPLTNRELDVLELLAQRLQNKEIAEKLFISTETVKGHLKNIFQKLAVSNRREAVEKAKSLGIL